MAEQGGPWLVGRRSVGLRRLSLWPIGCTPALSVTKAPLQLWCAACGAIQVLYAFGCRLQNLGSLPPYEELSHGELCPHLYWNYILLIVFGVCKKETKSVKHRRRIINRFRVSCLHCGLLCIRNLSMAMTMSVFL